MRAVGKLHKMGVANRMKMAPAYPALATVSSNPNGPPATMK